MPGTGTVYIDAKQTVIRRRRVADGFHEELTVLNHSDEPIDVKVAIEAASDFADLFEVKDALARRLVLDRSGRRFTPPHLPARHIFSGDHHLCIGTVRDGQRWAHVPDSC